MYSGCPQLWDFIFADSYLHWSATGELSMPLVDFMAVSMILQVRSKAITKGGYVCSSSQQVPLSMEIIQRACSALCGRGSLLGCSALVCFRYPPVDCVEPLVGRALRLRDGDAALSPRIVCDDTVEDDEKVLTMTMEVAGSSDGIYGSSGVSKATLWIFTHELRPSKFFPRIFSEPSYCHHPCA